MSTLHEWVRRLRGTLGGTRTDADLEAELRSHLELAAEDGRAPQRAGVAQAMETLRDQRGLPWLEEIWRDLAFAFRMLRRSPGFTAVVVLTLGLAIGVNTTVFTFVNAILLRGLPFDQPDRIVSLVTEDARGRVLGVSRPDFEDWRNQSRSFAGLAMYQFTIMNVSDEGRAAEMFRGAYGTTNLFAVVGERPLLGRVFQADDERAGAEPVVVLGNGVWTTRYGRDAGILGRAIRVNGHVATVIGVMPQGIHFPGTSDLWMPWSSLPPAQRNAPRQVRTFSAFGRLVPGVEIAQARTELETIGGRLSHDFPGSNADFRPSVQPYEDTSATQWLPTTPARIRLIFYSLWGAVAFVLVIACANVANLLLVRASRRGREVAIRLSLGAGHWRVIRQLLVEGLVLSALSGALGLGLSVAGVRIFDTLLASVNGRPAWMTFPMNGRVLALLAATCLATPLLFGAMPAAQVAMTDIHDALKEAGGRSMTAGVRAHRWTRILVSAEIALTIVLLAGAGFMTRSFLEVRGRPLGVETSHLLTSSIFLPPEKYGRPQDDAAAYARLEERLAGVAAIQASGLVTNYPLYDGGFVRSLARADRPSPEETPTVRIMGVSTTYFDTIGVRSVLGRELAPQDGVAGRIGAVVNQRLASMYFSDTAAVGHQITLSDPGQGPRKAPAITATIAGVVPDFGQHPEDLALPIVYVPYQAVPQPGMFLVVRAPGDPLSVAPIVRDEVRAFDPDVPLMEIQTMDHLGARVGWPLRVFGTMFAVFAVIALIISGVGLYAVTAYSVAERTAEIGVRMALGARADHVRWLVLRRAAGQLVIALPIGIAGAFGVGRLLQGFLIRTSGHDPIVIGSIALIMAAVFLTACIVPARRAAQLDPLRALREE